jgi:hypothetical protein
MDNYSEIDVYQFNIEVVCYEKDFISIKNFIMTMT